MGIIIKSATHAFLGLVVWTWEPQLPQNDLSTVNPESVDESKYVRVFDLGSEIRVSCYWIRHYLTAIVFMLRPYTYAIEDICLISRTAGLLAR